MKRLLTIACMATLMTFGCSIKEAEHGGPVAHDVTHWSYSGGTGPEHWGELDEAWELCGDGMMQSPIDVPALEEMEQTELPPLRFDYDATPLAPFYNGHSVQVNYNPGSYLHVGNDRYELKQLHFHTPSEHTFTGRQWPLEMHLVHQNEAGEYAVVAVFGRIDDGINRSPAFAPIVANMPEKEVSAPPESAPAGGATLNAENLFVPSKNYITYTGSLTTPPCTEGVRWILNGAASRLSEEDVAVFHAVLGDDARPVQPLNGRVVKSTGR